MITLHFIYTLCYTYINLLLWHFTLHALYLYYITYVICNLVYKNDINLNKHILYYIFIFLFWKITFLDKKVQEKLFFFHNSLQPLLRLHRCKRPSKLSTRCECTVTPIGWIFFAQTIAAECWRGRGGILSRILEKLHTIFNEHPVYFKEEGVSIWVFFIKKREYFFHISLYKTVFPFFNQ